MADGFGVTVLFLSDMLILAICKKRLLTVTVNYMSACVAKIFISDWLALFQYE